MVGIFLNSKELAQRWRLSNSTLERWRWLGVGPQFIKVGGRVRYRFEAITEYENTYVAAAKRRPKVQNTSDNTRGFV